MDILDDGRTGKDGFYFTGRQFFRAIHKNDVVLRKKISDCLRSEHKEAFIQKNVFPVWLLPYPLLKELSGNSFEQAIPRFFSENTLTKPLPQTEHYIRGFLGIAKNIYLGQLFAKYDEVIHEQGSSVYLPDTNKETTPKVTTGSELNAFAVQVLVQMEKSSRNYFVWYYINQFNIEQLAAITGEATEAVPEQLWLCRKNFLSVYNRYAKTPLSESGSESCYLQLMDYFDNRLYGESENRIINLFSKDTILQECFQSELALRYGLNRTMVLQQLPEQREGAEMPANDFIALVKQVIQNASGNE